MFLFLSFLPILTLIISIAIFKDTLKSTLVSYLITLALFFFYGVYAEKILMTHYESLFTGIKIFLLVFSLLLLFNSIEKKKLLSHLKQKSLKVFVTIGIFFTILIEGLVGFGTPSMLATRTLIDIGFNPLYSAIISLQSDLFSTFGAFALPINVVHNFAISLDFLKYVSISFSIFLFIIIFYASKLSREKITIDIIFAFLIFSISSFFLSSSQYFMFTIVISSILSLLFLFSENLKITKEFIKFIYPFIIGILIYILLNQFEITIIKTFGIGLVFLLVALFYKKININNLKEPFKKSLRLFLIVFLLSCISSFYTISEFNKNNYPSASKVIIENLKSLNKELIFFITPLIGLLGAFIFGSATVSNLTFFNLQKEIAIAFNLNVDKILALQCIGAGIGNIISLYNISALVALSEELKNKEVEILKTNIVFALLFSFISSLLILFL